jgi:hypothetical protein
MAGKINFENWYLKYRRGDDGKKKRKADSGPGGSGRVEVQGGGLAGGDQGGEARGKNEDRGGNFKGGGIEMEKRKGNLADPIDKEITGEPETINPVDETEQEKEKTSEPETETDALPRIETHTETQSLKCILTHDEIKQAGERMARAVGEKKDNEDTLKSVSSRYKSLIDEAVAVMGSEAEKIRSGYEFRKVEVRVELDHSRGTVERFRTDTFECLESRRMTDYEAQRKIKF